MTVFLAIVGTAYFTRPHAQSEGAPGPRYETLGSVGELPDGWRSRAVEWLATERVRMDRGETRELVRIVERSAARFDVDPLVVLAVIHVESRYDASAVSSRGALGLMQLRPDTAREIAGRLGIEWTSDDLLFDPEVNVTIGTCYLRHLLDRFDGNLDAAFAAYEAGPGRIEGRIARSDEVPLRYSDRVWKALLDLQTRVVA